MFYFSSKVVAEHVLCTFCFKSHKKSSKLLEFCKTSYLKIRHLGNQQDSKQCTVRWYYYFSPAVHGAMGCGQKNVMLVWQGQQLLSGFLAKGHLPRVSHQSHLSPNDKVDNDMIPWGCAQISWHLPYSWGKSQKTIDECRATSHCLK